MTEPDWYLDHVLIRSSPGSTARIVITEADQWQVWWQANLAQVRRDFPQLAELAACQGLVLTSRQLADGGLTRSVVRRLVRHGQWSAPQPGLVALVGPVAIAADGANRFVQARRRHAMASAAAALANPGHVISGRSSAVLRCLPTRQVPQQVELSSAHRASARRGAREATLDPTDVGTWFGVAATLPARTCVDLARHDRRAGLMAADSALHQSLTSPAELESTLERARGWRGVRQAREIVRFADPRAESPLESVTRLGLHDSGFPPPEPQFTIAVPGRHWPLRVDLCWPERRLVLEADGRTKYVGDENWREKKREALLRPLGYRVERVIWSDIERDWPVTSAYLWSALGR